MAGASYFGGALEAGALNLRPLSNSPFTNSALIKNTANDGVFFSNSDVTKYAGLKTDGTFATNGNLTVGGSGTSTFAGAVTVTGATTLNNDVYQTALKKFYVDSGSNTYFHENSADSFQIVTGGTIAFTLTASSGLFNGTVIAPAATTSLASLRIPHGTAPTSPTNGDMWTTTAGLFIRINGATVGPLS